METVDVFNVGDRVRLVTNAARRGMGSVKIGSVGVIHATNHFCGDYPLVPGTQRVVVNFPDHKDWWGYSDEFVLVAKGSLENILRRHHAEFEKTSQISFLEKNFDFNSAGLIVFKTFFEEVHSVPLYWDIKAGSILEETVSFDQDIDCSFGINVGTSEWVKANTWRDLVWEGLVRWPWLAGVSVPKNSDGKIRVERLELVKSYTRREFCKKY